MAKYTVAIPIAGSISIDVEADDEEAAIAEAWEAYGTVEGDREEAGQRLEWEAYETMTDGNVNHFGQNEIEVTSDE